MNGSRNKYSESALKFGAKLAKIFKSTKYFNNFYIYNLHDFRSGLYSIHTRAMHNVEYTAPFPNIC